VRKMLDHGKGPHDIRYEVIWNLAESKKVHCGEEIYNKFLKLFIAADRMDLVQKVCAYGSDNDTDSDLVMLYGSTEAPLTLAIPLTFLPCAAGTVARARMQGHQGDGGCSRVIELFRKINCPRRGSNPRHSGEYVLPTMGAVMVIVIVIVAL
jgi:hypothetical protein